MVDGRPAYHVAGVMTVPRPERRLDITDGPVQEFAAELRRLRQAAGSPGYRELARRAHFSVTTLAEAAAGRRLPTLAVTLAYVEACGGDRVEWRARWQAIAAGLDTAGVAAGGVGRKDDVDPPYRGLAAYQPEDAGWFFGRDQLVAELVDRLADERLVAVFGPSGCGKSSLLRAGLVPAVAADSGSRLVIVMTPGARPWAELAKQLTELVPSFAATPVDNARLWASVRQALAVLPPHAEFLLVVDQFEEVFTLCREDAEREAFISALLSLAGVDEARTRVVLGVRADFYAACAGHPDLVVAIRDRQVLVGAMTAVELREAVVRPAERAGLMVEGALVTTVVAEVAGKPGALPLASHALLEVWRRRRGNTLTLAGYEAAGGVQYALARTAEAVYGGFTGDRRSTARQVMTRLVALGEGVADTRRRAPRAELDLPGVDEVLDELARARLITLGRETVEIAHEALIRGWPRLRRWLAADQEGLRIHRQLTEAAHAWLSVDRDGGSLYRGARLAAAREWAAGEGVRGTLTEVEGTFLDGSVELADRESVAAARRGRQLRVLAAGLAVLLCLVTAVSVVALDQRRDAVAARQIAISRQLAVQALTLANSAPGTAMLLSVQAWRTAPTLEARNAVLSMAAHQAYGGDLAGHQGAVSDLVFTPDGRTVFSASFDHTVRVWDVRSKRQVAVLAGHDTWLTAMALSLDGRTFATGGDDHNVVLWDVARSAPVSTLTGHSGQIRRIAFSPDGRLLATASDDGAVMLWDLAHRTRLDTLPGPGGAVHGVTFSPDGRVLATTNADGTVMLWDLANRTRLTTLTGHVKPAAVAAFSPDGRLLATGGGNTTAILWDVATGARVATFTHGVRDDSWIITLAFSPDGRTLATAGNDTAVLLWDTKQRVLRSRLVGHFPNIYALDFHLSGTLLASAGEGGRITLWDLSRSAMATDGSANDVAFSPDGRTLVTASGPRTTEWDIETRTPRAAYTGQPDVTTVAFSPDGRTVATAPLLAQQPGELTLRSTAGASPVRLIGHTDYILDVAFSPDSQMAATGSADGTVILWDLARGTRVATLTGHTHAVNGVAFSPDGRTLASGGHERAIMLWDVQQRTRLATLTGHTGWIRTVAFSPDGRYLASGDTDQTAILWDAGRRTPLATFNDHADAVFTGVAFSPDTRTFAYTSADHTVVLWDIDRRAPAARLTGHTQPVRSLAFSPDGRTLATAGEDQTIILWNTDHQQITEDICRALARDLTRQEWQQFLPDVAHQKTCTNT